MKKSTYFFITLLLLLLAIVIINQKQIGLFPLNSSSFEEESHLTQPPVTTEMTLSLDVAPSKKIPDLSDNPSEDIDPLLPSPTASIQLSIEEKLYQASLKFIADTPEKAHLIAKEIDYLVGDSEDACNMCGSLSIAILKEAGLLPKEADVHDAWLLCARENREDCYGIETLEKNIFPPDEYEYIRVYESVRDYDFQSNPLLPGDWLYLFTYIHGYDHMLVVTRVDEMGNPYTVTNVDWGEGFIIAEMKLYDTDNPEDGLFYELTKIERRRIGMMGTAGFLLVRKNGGISEYHP
ncbi:MAG TPA: hypothetical protein VK856_04035 [Anaerolineaceae bacterium]|nr:hypothetical protein [Anaerolineaceae bacterium]